MIKGRNRIYFIGIGGIGMSALARHFKSRGFVVSGYDRQETELTRSLVREGIPIRYDEEESARDPQADLVIYTPAISPDHPHRSWYAQNGFTLAKRSEVLQEITNDRSTIAVAGTHGKTTISTLIAYLMRETGRDPQAFLGGISVNYETNYLEGEGPWTVVEADEYDRSFLRLSPQIGLITAMDADHMEIFGSMDSLKDAFQQYVHQIRPGGALLRKFGIGDWAHAGIEEYSYSLQNEAADFYASDIVQRDGGYGFRLQGPDWELEGLRLNIGGMHNLENAVAALAVLRLLGAEGPELQEALSGFRGVKRRFEYLIHSPSLVYIDDYAHHPQELAALISSVRRLFPKRRTVVAFQPHLYSRTRDMAAEFARALDQADQVILLDIYPAREKPMEGVSAQWIADRMANPQVSILSREGLLKFVENAPLDLFITAGAGDIDQLVKPIEELLKNK